MYSIASYLYHPSRGSPAAFVIWSDLDGSNGSKLATAIAEKFGKLIGTPSAENPKTSNEIRIWAWEIMHEKFKEWYKAEKINRIKKEG